jgi:hypothetical protein
LSRFPIALAHQPPDWTSSNPPVFTHPYTCAPLLLNRGSNLIEIPCVLFL